MLLLAKISPTNAAVIFSDSFRNPGYNVALWTIPTSAFPPLPSPFGIEYDQAHIGNYSALQYSSTLEGNFIIKIDEKINSSPPSDLSIEFRGPNGQWKLVNFYGIGIGGLSNTIKAYDSNNFGYGTASWDVSGGVRNLEVNMSPSANSPVIVKVNGVPLLNWISSVGFSPTGFELWIYGSGSEFANFQLCDSGGCDAPSPTPTPIPVTKVVVVPGLGGSWNKDALMNCNPNVSTPWTSWGGSDLVYGSLLSSLQGSGFIPEPFYYDWRKQVPDLKPLLMGFVNENLVPFERVNIVGHSMGGLVAREYIEKEGGGNKADKFYSVGAPHQGTILAYPAWSAGEIWGSLPFRIAATTVIKNCWVKYPWLSDREIVRQFIPSIQNLLPVFDYIKRYKTNDIIHVSGMDAKNNWLLPDTPPYFINTLYGTLSGYGYGTLNWLDVVNPGPRDGEGNWLDGKPKKKEYTNDGDAVVLNVNSMLNNAGAGDKSISQDHNGLVASSEGIDAILRFLTLGTNAQILPSTALYAPFKTALVVMSDTANFSVSMNGKTQKDKEGIIVFMNPKSGNYNVHVLPKSDTTRIIVAQFLEDRTLWKEYKLTGTSAKNKTIQFDAIEPIEDALK